MLIHASVFTKDVRPGAAGQGREEPMAVASGTAPYSGSCGELGSVNGTQRQDWALVTG